MINAQKRLAHLIIYEFHYLMGRNRTAKQIRIISKATKGIAVIIILILSLIVISSIWLGSSPIVPSLAAIGGCIVFLGLWIEKEANDESKPEHTSNLIGTARFLKIKAETGWWILMLGIALEVLIAGGVAMRDQLNIINAAYNGRRLTEAQKKKFESDLRKLNKCEVEFNADPAIPDSKPFVNDLSECFTNSGFNLDVIDRMELIPPFDWIQVGTYGGTNLVREDSIVKSLNDMGFPAKRFKGFSERPGVLCISIGAR